MNDENITNKQPLIRYVNRQQMSWRAVDVEKLIGEDHSARAIWSLVGRHGRSVAHLEESAVVIAFRKKMASEEAQQRYGRRGRIVEFCHAWIKSKLGLRQFHVRGLVKAQMEMLWACLTYNLQHWIRLNKLRATPAVT